MCFEEKPKVHYDKANENQTQSKSAYFIDFARIFSHGLSLLKYNFNYNINNGWNKKEIKDTYYF
jgi:hypothetical protein